MPLPNDSDVAARAAAHLRALGRAPRPTGGNAAAEGRRYCAGVLRSLGFVVVERPFEYSAAVGQLGTPAGGAAALLLVLGAAGASLENRPLLALGVLVVGGALVMLAGRWAARRGVLDISARRRQGVNLEARRAATAPRIWLVAHIDSKSQPISLIVRAGAIVVLALASLGAAVLAVRSALGGSSSSVMWEYVVAAAAIGAIPAMASIVGSRSPGAVDNASGVATVLAAAELAPEPLLGVLITDAEELGLAGARAWCAASDAPHAAAVNCDGVDDVGMLTLMWTRPRATRLEGAMRAAAAESGEPLRIIPLIPGVLVDGLALSDAGWEVVTLSRGSAETLRHIHTQRDDLARLSGSGVAATARVLARAVGIIVEQR